MTANNHTIGNWKTGRPYATTGVIPIRNEHGMTVAHVTHPSWGYDDTPTTDVEAKANARLIAAAPRMYDALQTIAMGNTDPDDMVELAKAAMVGIGGDV